MSYQETFIQIAPDSTASYAVVPVSKGDKKTIHQIQYELLTEKPYYYDHDELNFAVYAIRQGFSEGELTTNGKALRAEFFKKGHPCLRASALTKKYGWGAHYNADGKIALYPMESTEYQAFIEQYQGTKNLLDAMRSKRK